MKTKKENKEIPFIQNDNLPVIAIDSARLSVRKDGLFYIQLGAVVPEGIKEQCRIMTPAANLKIIINALCTGSGFYPVNSKEKSEVAAETKIDQEDQ